MKRLDYEYFRDLAGVISFMTLTFSLGATHIFSVKVIAYFILVGFASLLVCATFMTIRKMKKIN
jgi:uncharacterized membrane protein